MANNPFSKRSEARFQEIDILKQTIEEKEITQQKEQEIQQQEEVLKKAKTNLSKLFFKILFLTYFRFFFVGIGFLELGFLNHISNF